VGFQRCNDLIATGLAMRFFIDKLSSRTRVAVAIVVLVTVIGIITFL
jgi:hypothetical protein